MATKRLQDDLPEGESVQLEDVDNEVEDTEDGGAIIREKNDIDHATKLAHFANIVDEVDQDMLKTAINDLMEKIGNDKDNKTSTKCRRYKKRIRRTSGEYKILYGLYGI